VNDGNHGAQDAERKKSALHEVRAFHDSQDFVALRSERIAFQRVGYRKYDIGAQKWRDEKGVDVAMAVAMVSLAPIYEVAIVVSGDADMIPAMREVKAVGRTVAVPEFYQPNVPGTAGPLVSGQAESVFLEADLRFRLAADDIYEQMGPPPRGVGLDAYSKKT
jgi:hypothetical protein